MRLYIDACIWRDYWENRSDNFRPLGEWVFELIRLAITEHKSIVLSEWIFEELRTEYADEVIQKIFEIVPQKARLPVVVTRVQHREATVLARERRVPYGDALHAVLARDNNALMITRDRDFEHLTDIVDIRKPEDLL